MVINARKVNRSFAANFLTKASESNNKCKQLLELLRIKNSAEYAEKLMTQNDANSAQKSAERLLFWAKDVLKRKQ